MQPGSAQNANLQPMVGRLSFQYQNRHCRANHEGRTVSPFISRHALNHWGFAFLVIGIAGQWTAAAQPPDNTQQVVDAAQQVTEPRASNPETSTDPKLKLSPIETLRRFEPPKDDEYTLGAGDEISIQYPGRPELASKNVIGPDGRITLPLAGPIEIANLTREAAAEKIVATLSTDYTNLTATVEVTKYGSNHVTLLGDVKNPGQITFDQTPTLLEVLSRGGIETRPDGNLPEQCVIYRGDQVLWVDLEGLLVDGSPLADLRLRRNDLIFVPAVSTRSVTVMGQVQHPGQIALRHNSTLTSI